MSYALPADMLARYSNQTLGELCSDTSVAITPTALPTDPNLQAALNSAAGKIESAVLQAGRYTVANLLELTGNSLAYLVDINCSMAMTRLFRRKPLYKVDEYKAALDIENEVLEMLRTGESIFDVAANIAAGTPKFDAPQVAAVESKLFIRDRTLNYFPVRTSQSG